MRAAHHFVLSDLLSPINRRMPVTKPLVARLSDQGRSPLPHPQEENTIMIKASTRILATLSLTIFLTLPAHAHGRWSWRESRKNLLVMPKDWPVVRLEPVR